MNNLIIVTPAKNEGDNLSEVASAVIKQTMKPTLWIIVDDGSTDETPDIIKSFETKHNWIKSIKLNPTDRDITFHYSHVCKMGFDYATKYCDLNAIDYRYILLLDADTILERQYVEKLTNEFKKNTKLGIASGGIYYNINGKLKWLKSSETLPAGTGRMWLKECFMETGGYIVEPSPDSISNVKAVLRGWEIKKFKHIVAVQKRVTSSAEGFWNGYKANGFMYYYLNSHPLLVLLNTIYYTTKKPYYIGIAFFYGYLSSILKRKTKIDDEEIKNYYWNEKFKSIIKEIKNIRI